MNRAQTSLLQNSKPFRRANLLIDESFSDCWRICVRPIDSSTVAAHIPRMAARKKHLGTTTLTLALSLIGRDRNWFNHLQTNRVLKTKFEESEGGRARMLSRENVLELAFISALRDLNSVMASHIASNWIQAERSGSLQENFAFAPGPLGYLPSEQQRAYFHSNRTLREVARRIRPSVTLSGVPEHDATLPEMAETFRIIRISEIVRRVDALLDRGKT